MTTLLMIIPFIRKSLSLFLKRALWEGAFFSAQKYFAKIVKKLLTNNKNCDTLYTDQTERAPEGVG